MFGHFTTLCMKGLNRERALQHTLYEGNKKIQLVIMNI